ncbi:MAG: redoxin domain-containing protein [Vicinamibacterales bacterium]
MFRFPARLCTAFAFAAAAVALGTPLFGQQPPPAMPDVRSLGPQVGSKVPDFSLPDQHGETRTLRSLMGPKGMLLVFYRSADWCPYCKTQLAELQARLPQLSKEGLGLAAISYDPVPVIADFTRRRGITFPLLSDAGSATIRKYGIFNTTVPASNAQSYGIPFPGTFVLDRDGLVTARFFEPAYQERATVGSMLARLGNDLEVQATTVRSPQLEVVSYVTDSVVAPGTHFSVVLDAKPSAGIHVYAPGVTGYKPITLTIAPQVGVLVRGAQFPTPETYLFVPLNERVQVYQRPFRIVQDLAIDATPEGVAALKGESTLTLRGTLGYQACDDRICFSPQTVPLTWTVKLRELDRERAVR